MALAWNDFETVQEEPELGKNSFGAMTFQKDKNQYVIDIDDADDQINEKKLGKFMYVKDQ